VAATANRVERGSPGRTKTFTITVQLTTVEMDHASGLASTGGQKVWRGKFHSNHHNKSGYKLLYLY
jgi:hypothetical protein